MHKVNHDEKSNLQCTIKNHDDECELLFFAIIEMGKMWSGRALQKSLFICNACGYKAKLVLGFFILKPSHI